VGAATPRTPALQVVNSVGTVIAGPYLIAPGVTGTALATGSALGLTLATIDAWEEAEVIGPWKNFLWQQVVYPLGYRYHASLRFVGVESDTSSNQYGLALLHNLWQQSVNNALTFAALQFRMFTTSTWRPVVAGSFEWRPSFAAGKQGLYEVDLALTSRELIATPGEWAQSAW
jgi:hypothetical protein